MGDVISESSAYTRTIDVFLITVLVVITNQGIQGRADEIANIETVGVQCAGVVVAVEFLFNITNRDEAIAIEGPVVGDGFCINGDLVEEDRLLIKDRDVGIGIARCDGAGVIAGIQPLHPAAITIQPAVAQACGGGEATIHIGVDHAALAIAVSKADVDEGIEIPNAVLTNRQWQEAPIPA